MRRHESLRQKQIPLVRGAYVRHPPFVSEDLYRLIELRYLYLRRHIRQIRRQIRLTYHLVPTTMPLNLLRILSLRLKHIEIPLAPVFPYGIPIFPVRIHLFPR